MNLIILKFLTEKGAKAYQKVDEEGKKESWQNRQIARRVARDRIVCQNPFTVEITIKIPRLAIQIDMPAQIEEGLSNYGAKLDRDYTMEVK